MRKYFTILFTMLILGGSFTSCSPDEITEGDVEMDLKETQSIHDRGRVRDTPDPDED